MSKQSLCLISVSLIISSLSSVNGFLLNVWLDRSPPIIPGQSQFALRAGLDDLDEEDDVYNDDLIYSYEFTPNLSDNGDQAYSYSRQRAQHHEGGALVDKDSQILRRLVAKQRMKVLDELMILPPNNELGAVDFVRCVLSALLDPDTPLPDSGFRLLLRASSPHWRSLVCCSVGAPNDADEDQVVRALRNAVGRPSNHFGILVGADDDDQYRITFTNEVVKKSRDGKCIVECELRGQRDNELLVTMRWLLSQNKDDNALLIDHIDWKDFRDGYQYRP